MPNSRFYSSTAAVTSLQSTAGPSDVTIQVASSSGFPNSFPFTLSLDYGSANEELVDVTGGGPSIFNVTRAVDGTSATTHNSGAVVRHVSSARDFTDSRTHEASTSNVHGITGSFVDTLSTQTLSNKTLTNPTINNATVTGTVTATGATVSGGTLSGSTLTNDTFSGANTMASGATISGAWTNTGDLTNTGQLLQQNLVRGQRTNTTDSIYETRAAGDARARWFMTADGSQDWSDGTNPADISLARTNVATGTFTGNLIVTGNENVNGSLIAAGALTGTDLTLTAQAVTNFVPVWNNLGGATINTNLGWYIRYGKVIHFNICTVFSGGGTGTSGIWVAAPTTPFRQSNGRQFLGTAWFDNMVKTGTNPSSHFTDQNCMGQYETFASDIGTVTATLVSYKADTLTAAAIQANTTVTLQGWYREA